MISSGPDSAHSAPLPEIPSALLHAPQLSSSSRGLIGSTIMGVVATVRESLLQKDLEPLTGFRQQAIASAAIKLATQNGLLHRTPKSLAPRRGVSMQLSPTDGFWACWRRVQEGLLKTRGFGEACAAFAADYQSSGNSDGRFDATARDEWSSFIVENGRSFDTYLYRASGLAARHGWLQHYAGVHLAITTSRLQAPRPPESP